MSDFPPVFCLTLAEEPWKEASVREHFKERGIGAIVYHGFHGMLIGLRPTNPFQFDRDGTPEFIHIAQAGCAVSHIAMLKMAIATEATEFICCEDDVDLVEGFKDKWIEVRNDMPSDIDVVQIEYIRNQWNKKVGENYQPVPMPFTEISKGLAKCAGFGHCSGATWWRSSAAVKAVTLARPIDGPWDIMLMRKVYPYCNHALCDPPLATQKSAHGLWPSSIGSSVGGGKSPEGIPFDLLTH